jgi:hypothetical protein
MTSYKLTLHEVELAYEDLSLKEVFKLILPDVAEVPSSYE